MEILEEFLFKMVEEEHYRDRKSGINFCDFQPSKIKSLLVRSSYHESYYSQVMLNNFWPTEFWMNLNTGWFYNFFVVVFNFRMIVVQNNKNIFVDYAVSCCENLCLWYKDATTYRFAIFNNGDLPRPALKIRDNAWLKGWLSDENSGWTGQKVCKLDFQSS